MKRISIHDVAAHVGTSPATVSKVLNNVPASGIAGQTRERVLRSAAALGYIPSAAAQSLRRQRAATIGLLINDLGPFTAEIVSGVSNAAVGHGLTTVLALHRDQPVLEAQHLQLGLRGQVDGLVIIPARASPNQATYDLLRARQVPFVFVSRYLPGYEADYVGVENEAAAYHLTRLLLAQGAQRPAFLAGAAALTSTSIVERLAGFRRALREGGLSEHPDGADAQPGERKEAVFARLLDGPSRPDAILWGSFFEFGGVLRVMAKRHLRVPADLRFAGFDLINLTLANASDYAALEAVHTPWPTAIQPGAALGQHALDLLLERQRDPAPSAPRRLLLPPIYQWLDGDLSRRSEPDVRKGGTSEASSYL